MLSGIFAAFIVAFVLWFIWPTVRPKIARSPSEAGTEETNHSLKELEEQLNELNAQSLEDPSLRDDVNWLMERESLWAQINYLNLCNELNNKWN